MSDQYKWPAIAFIGFMLAIAVMISVGVMHDKGSSVACSHACSPKTMERWEAAVDGKAEVCVCGKEAAK